MSGWRAGRGRLIALVGLVLVTRAAAFSAPAPDPPLRLVLFVSVDQMRFDYLTRFESLFQGGLRTLLEEGAVFVNASYRHAGTETGPGHAVLLSGRNGSHPGTVANEGYDALSRGNVNVVDDPAHAPMGGIGRGTSAVRVHPRWRSAWDEARKPDRFFGRKWPRLLADEAVYERMAGADAGPGEHDGVDNVFPHGMRGRPPESIFYHDLRRTPFADELTLE